MSDSTLVTITSVPADVVLTVGDAVWHQVNLPALYGTGLTITATDGDGAPVDFMVAWPSSGAAEAGTVTETANARRIPSEAIAIRYELASADDRSPRAPHVFVGLEAAPAAAVRFELTVD